MDIFLCGAYSVFNDYLRVYLYGSLMIIMNMIVLNTIRHMRPNIIRHAKHAVIIQMIDKRVFTSITHVLTMITESTKAVMPYNRHDPDPWWLIRDIISPVVFFILPQASIVYIFYIFDKFGDLFTISTINNVFLSILYMVIIFFVANIQSEFLCRYIVWAINEGDNNRNIAASIKYVESEKKLD